MTLTQLRYFCTAAQLRSFSKAAEAEHISQPSLSISLHKLEQEFGVALFVPDRKGAVLTEAGRLFLQDAQRTLEQADLAAAHMWQFAQRDRAEVRLAYTASVADCYIPRLLKAFSEAEGKGCCIYSDEMPSDQIAQGLREGRFDLGLGSQLPPDPDLVLQPIAYQRFCLLLPSGWAQAPFEQAQQLQGHPLIGYRKDYPMHRQLTALFDRLGGQPSIVHYAYSESAIARLVEQGLGIAIVAETEGLAQYRVQLLHPAWLTGGRYLYLMRHRTRTISQAARQLEQRILAGAQDAGSLPASEL